MHACVLLSTAKERDDANSNPRLENIEIELRQIEGKWDDLKRKQTECKEELDSLQESADAHTAIATLDEELTREYEALEESVKDCSSLLCRFNLQDLEKLPKLGGDGQAVVDAVEHMGVAIRDKLHDAQDRLSAATNAHSKQENLYSEKSWLLRAGIQSLQSLHQQRKNLTEGAVATVRAIVQKMRELDPDMAADEKSPVELREYIDKKIERLNDELALADPTVIKAVV